MLSRINVVLAKVYSDICLKVIDYRSLVSIDEGNRIKKHLSIINLFSFRLSVVYHTVKVKEVQKCRDTPRCTSRAPL